MRRQSIDLTKYAKLPRDDTACLIECLDHNCVQMRVSFRCESDRGLQELSGDFFVTFIGEDRVICVRDNDGNPQVLVNTCRHRGNAICRAEEGHATSFMCTYHGWTYDLKGALVGVPGFKEVYHEELDRENWGLIKAGKVDSYMGFIFATMDPQAPDLDEYLGEVGRISIKQVALRGDIQVQPGIQKYTIQCNWKLAVDNVWDFYHGGISHASSLMARGLFTLPFLP